MEQGTLGVALVVLIVVSSLLAVVYVGRIVEQLWFGEPAAEGVVVREAPPLMLAVTWLAVIANIWFGLDASVPGQLAGQAATDFLRHMP